MASELRVNSSTNRSGLGTITYTDSGPIISGVGTFTNGFTVDGTQTTVKSLKLTGDNYNANWFKTSSTFRLNDNAKLNIGSADDMQQYHDGTTSYIKNTTGVLRIENTASNIGIYASDANGDIIMRAGGATSSENAIVAVHHGEVTLAFNGSTKLTTTNTGLTLTGIINGPTQLNLSNTGGDLINVTSTTAASRSTIKFNTNGNDWELGARGSSLDPENSFYLYNSDASSYYLRVTADDIVETGTAVNGSGFDGNQRLRVGRTGDCNIAVRATGSTTSATGLDFGDQDDDRAGRIQYVHDGNYMSFHTNGAGSGSANEQVRIDSAGRLLVNTTSASISSSELFEVKSTGSGFSHFRNNHSGYAPIYIDNEYTNTAMAPLITITDGGGNRAGLLLNNVSLFDITGQGGISFSTGGTVGNATERNRIDNDGISGAIKNNYTLVAFVSDRDDGSRSSGSNSYQDDTGLNLSSAITYKHGDIIFAEALCPGGIALVSTDTANYQGVHIRIKITPSSGSTQYSNETIAWYRNDGRATKETMQLTATHYHIQGGDTSTFNDNVSLSFQVQYKRGTGGTGSYGATGLSNWAGERTLKVWQFRKEL